MLWKRRSGRQAAWLALFVVLSMLLGLLGDPAGAQRRRGRGGGAADPNRFEQTGSQSQYVHRIKIYDAQGQPIDPSDPNAPPYSPKQTCSKCHDYEAIASGYHFNAPSPPAGSQTEGPLGSRRGEPWILTDEQTGTQIPITYRNWPGTFEPGEVGLSPWEFVMRFARHMPGGGPGEAHPEGEEASDAAKWNLAGDLQIDCMVCHSAGRAWSQEAWADQIADENFAWAPTAALGLGEIEGSVSRLPADFQPAGGEGESSEDGGEGGGGPSLPAVNYDLERFNAENEVFFDVVAQPPNNACYRCHSDRPVGPEAEAEWVHEQDIHVQAGISCVDCHRNGIGHHTVRGFPGEVHPTGQDVETLSCAGCHLGSEEPGAGLAGAGGLLGAPRPDHFGIPPIHFEQMTCTSCHSGPLPDEDADRIQTAMAHGLGLPSQERTDEDLPAILAPVYLENANGRVAPHRMVWPAYWGVLKESGEIEPIEPEEASRAVRRAFRVRSSFRQKLMDVSLSDEERAAVLGAERAGAPEGELTEEERAALAAKLEEKAAAAFREDLPRALETLARGREGMPVYVAGGKAYRLSEDGEGVVSFVPPQAAPYSWPLAHEVRPARLALGANGCKDCHSTGSPFSYGTVAAVGPAPDAVPPVASMYELQNQNPTLLAAWAQSFRGRSLFKVLGVIALIVLVIVLAIYGAQGIGRLLRVSAGRGGEGR